MKKRFRVNILSLTLSLSVLVGISGGLLLAHYLTPSFLIRKELNASKVDSQKIEETRATLSRIDSRLINLSRLVENMKHTTRGVGNPPPGYTYLITSEGTYLITLDEANEKRRLAAAVGGPAPKRSKRHTSHNSHVQPSHGHSLSSPAQ